MKLIKMIVAYFFVIIFYFYIPNNLEIYNLPKIDGGNLMLFTYVISIIILFIIAIKNFKIVIKMVNDNYMVILLLIMCCFSQLWSDKIGVTSFIKLIGIFSFGILLCILYKKDIFKLVYYSICTYQIFGIILFIFKKDFVYYFEGRYFCYRGIFANKNAEGMVSCIAIILGFNYILRNKNMVKYILSILIFILNIILLIFSRATTSILCAIFIIVIFIIIKSYKRLIKKDIDLIYIFTTLIFINLFILLYFYFKNMQNSIMGYTLTNRTYIWNYCVNMLQGKLLYGYGFNSFWNESLGRVFYMNGNWDILLQKGYMECHNGFLEILMQLGLIGLMIYIVALVNRFTKINNKLKEDTNAEFQLLDNLQYLLIAIMFISLTESVGLILNSWILLIIIFILNFDITYDINCIYKKFRII